MKTSFGDAYFESVRDALAEASRRRSDPANDDMLTSIDRSGYGGWVVRSLPADFVIDSLAYDTPVIRKRATPRRYG